MNEYCVIELIYHLSNNPKSTTPGWCNAAKDFIAEQLGLSRRTVIDIINKCTVPHKERPALLERHAEHSNLLKISINWYDAVLIKSKDEQSADVAQGVQKVHTVSEKVTEGAETAQSVNKVHRECADSSQVGVQKVHTECADSSHNNDITRDITKDKNKNPETDEFLLIEFSETFIPWYNQQFGKSFDPAKLIADLGPDYLNIRRQFNLETVQAAYANLRQSAFHMGDNDGGKFYAVPGFLLKKASQVELWKDKKNLWGSDLLDKVQDGRSDVT